MNHSTSRRTAKALPQMESTIAVEGTDAQVICRTADQPFQVGNARIVAGETFYLVKSERRPGRYYMVHQNEHSHVWSCSCGQNISNHDHLLIAKSYKADHEVAPRDSETITQPAATPTTEPAISEPLTAEQWKEIALADRKRQLGWREEYLRKAKELRGTAGVA